MKIFEYDKINYINLMFSLVLIGLMSAVVIKPLISRVLVDYEELRIAQAVKTKLTKNLNSIDTMKKIQEDYAHPITLVPQALPSNSEDGVFLKSIQSLAINNKLNIIKTEFNYSTSPQHTLFKLDIDGRYDDFVLFLTNLNSLLRITNTETLNVTIDKDRGEGNIQATLSGKIFQKGK